VIKIISRGLDDTVGVEQRDALARLLPDRLSSTIASTIILAMPMPAGPLNVVVVDEVPILVARKQAVASSRLKKRSITNAAHSTGIWRQSACIAICRNWRMVSLLSTLEPQS
jgi:hypothetical protein